MTLDFPSLCVCVVPAVVVGTDTPQGRVSVGTPRDHQVAGMCKKVVVV